MGRPNDGRATDIPKRRVGLGLIEDFVPSDDDVLILTIEPTDGSHNDVVAVPIDPDLTILYEFEFEISDIDRRRTASKPLPEFLLNILDTPNPDALLVNKHCI